MAIALYHPTKSNHISRASYDSQSGELRIQFKNKTTYVHANVPTDVWVAFRNYRSAGEYYHARIKNYPLIATIKPNGQTQTNPKSRGLE
jgi:hypothetical protein